MTSRAYIHKGAKTWYKPFNQVMDCDSLINSRLKQLNELKSHLNDIDGKLLAIAKELNWDYKKLFEEDPSNMVICSINNQHRVPQSKLSSHEEKCRWRQEGYKDDDKLFPDHSGSGSFVTLTSGLLESITANVSPVSELQPSLRSVPQTSANFDQNFNREEKLAIYDYVIANTEKHSSTSYSDLCFQDFEKKGEKARKDMEPWEIAAAERDAKRRRASYRKKVHTSRKNHTEILREVIEVQMEILKETSDSRLTTASKSNKGKEDSGKRRRYDSRGSEDEFKYSNRETSSRRDRNDRHKSRNHDRHSKHRKDRTRKRSPSFSGSDSDSRSRSRDRFRKWKPYEGRSHSHKSSKYSLRDKDDSARSDNVNKLKH